VSNGASALSRGYHLGNSGQAGSRVRGRGGRAHLAAEQRF